jgi:hypothetical protein
MSLPGKEPGSEHGGKALKESFLWWPAKSDCQKVQIGRHTYLGCGTRRRVEATLRASYS